MTPIGPDLAPLPEFPADLPELALVVLVGVSFAGKSDLAARHFAPNEMLSLDLFRTLVAGEEVGPEAVADATECLMQVAGHRLKRGLLTVVDAPSVRAEERRRLIALAREYDVPAVAVVLDLPRPVLEARREASSGPSRPPVEQQVAELRRAWRGTAEGFERVWTLKTPQEVEALHFRRVPLPVSRKDLPGPFDFIGDVHGCLDELCELLVRLGYRLEGETATPPPGRTAVFVGDLVDRGPRSAGVLRLVMNMVASGAALCVTGNHDEKLRRALEGKAVRPLHGLDRTVAELETAGEALRQEVRQFIEGLPSHLVLDGGRVVVAHAGLPERYHGRSSDRVRRFALYGDVDGRTDEHGLPLRRDWAADYTGDALVVYGHTPVVTPQWVNRTLDIDTGCAFGGALTALRYPELELVRVEARAQYAVPSRPLLVLPDPEAFDPAEFLRVGRIRARAGGNVQLRPDERAAALTALAAGGHVLETRWCLYLPPHLSAPDPSRRAGELEHPAEAFEFYRRRGLTQVACEVRPPGRRAVLVVCRDQETAHARFGTSDEVGCLYDRWGKPAVPAEMRMSLLRRVHEAAERAGLWDTWESHWLAAEVLLTPDRNGAAESLRLWPLNLLATEGKVRFGNGAQELDALSEVAPDLFGRLERRRVTLGNAEEEAGALAWWETLSAGSTEGLLVRPPHALQDPQLQPALYVRTPAALERLRVAESLLAQTRARSLGAERARALRQHHLGLEALTRFVEGRGPGRIQECVLGILALALSESQSPRV